MKNLLLALMCLFTLACTDKYELNTSCPNDVSHIVRDQPRFNDLLSVAADKEAQGCEVIIIKNRRDTVYVSKQPQSVGLIHDHEHAPYTTCQGVLFLPPDDAFIQKLVSQ